MAMLREVLNSNLHVPGEPDVLNSQSQPPVRSPRDGVARAPGGALDGPDGTRSPRSPLPPRPKPTGIASPRGTNVLRFGTPPRRGGGATMTESAKTALDALPNGAIEAWGEGKLSRK